MAFLDTSTPKPVIFSGGLSQRSFTTPWGVGTLSNWGRAGSESYETSFVGSAYQLSCAFETPDDDNRERAVGCLLMSAMPSSCVHDALGTLWERYQFALEDLELDRP